MGGDIGGGGGGIGKGGIGKGGIGGDDSTIKGSGSNLKPNN